MVIKKEGTQRNQENSENTYNYLAVSNHAMQFLLAFHVALKTENYTETETYLLITNFLSRKQYPSIKGIREKDKFKFGS